jgi:hypothetical protein
MIMNSLTGPFILAETCRVYNKTCNRRYTKNKRLRRWLYKSPINYNATGCTPPTLRCINQCLVTTIFLVTPQNCIKINSSRSKEER